MKIVTLASVLLLLATAQAQPDGKQATKSVAKSAAPLLDLDTTLRRGCDILLEMQEGDDSREWPYEGVYRTNEGGRRRVIPIGYRVGGTSIAGLALIEAPGFADTSSRVESVERGVEFILEALDDPLMAPSTQDRYDVRGWGHIYALLFFLRMQELGVVPEAHAEAVTSRIGWLVDALEKSAIRPGGWNYAGRRRSSPFMTAPGLQALFQAAAHGHSVSDRVVDRALDALERGRAKSGSIAYGTPKESRAEVEEDELSFMDKLPGSIARMAVVETTLMRAGRGDPARLSAAVEAFFEHWEQLEKRRQKTGTHVRPYGVAPYYFMYGHYYVAQAIELLADEAERERQRDRFHRIMTDVQEEDGGWNDRVFPRSRNYGTAMGMMAIMMKDLPRPHVWPPQAK